MWSGHGTSTLGVVANVAAYTDGAAWLAETVDYLDGNRHALVDLESRAQVRPSLPAPHEVVYPSPCTPRRLRLPATLTRASPSAQASTSSSRETAMDVSAGSLSLLLSRETRTLREAPKPRAHDSRSSFSRLKLFHVAMIVAHPSAGLPANCL